MGLDVLFCGLVSAVYSLGIRFRVQNWSIALRFLGVGVKGVGLRVSRIIGVWWGSL